MAEGHKTGKRQSQDSDLGLLGPNCTPFPPGLPESKKDRLPAGLDGAAPLPGWPRVEGSVYLPHTGFL